MLLETFGSGYFLIPRLDLGSLVNAKWLKLFCPLLFEMEYFIRPLLYITFKCIYVQFILYVLEVC